LNKEVTKATKGDWDWFFGSVIERNFEVPDGSPADHWQQATDQGLRIHSEEVHLVRTESYVGCVKGFLKVGHSFRTDNRKDGKRLA
jgi:hypothetical protein